MDAERRWDWQIMQGCTVTLEPDTYTQWTALGQVGISWGIIKKWSRLAFLATKITNSITKKRGFDSWDFINFVSDWMGKQNDYDGNILDFTDLT